LEVLFRRVSTAVYKNSKGEQEPWVEGVIREEIVLARQEPSSSLVIAPIISPQQSESNPKPIPTLGLPEKSESSYIAPPISIAQLQAIRSLSSLDMKAETLSTKFFCEDGNCSDYEALYKTMREQNKFPELFTPTQKIQLCEFDLNVGACTEPVLNHGRGVNPFVLFQALFGTRIVTRNLMITQAKKTNGGGISFSAEPTVYIERLKLGNENASKCSQNPGRIELMSNQLEFEIASSICIAATPPIQVTKVYHTGADPMERLALRPEFEGAVQVGGRYVLVDDVTSLGGTLAELAHYIQFNGGFIQDVAVIVNAGRNKSLRPDLKTIKTLNERFANEIIEIFGIQVDALTANEAQYLVGFRTVDEIRNRLLKAKQEVDLRLRSKGIAGVFGTQDS
jgi:hypothetical protein